MDLNEVRLKIKNMRIMLGDMVNAQEISQEQGNLIAPVLLDIMLKGDFINGDYTPD